MKILAIETSCDETAAAVVEDGHCVLADPVATQIEIHRRYGGVVPELASRNHVVDIVPVVREALEVAGLGWSDIDAVAVTRGPGLVGALLVGLQVAKALAYAHDKPLVGVHHLAGHLHAVFLHRPGEERPQGPSYPHVALAVSGGHTALYRVVDPVTVEQLSNTRDDAAGEAFDKVSRMLGLGYPGGPIVERLARDGDPEAIRFTMPRFKSGALDFSFSGLKTAVLTQVQRMGEIPEGQARADLLASFQRAAVDQLVDRTLHAVRETGAHDVVLSGGVACNTPLRDRMRAALAQIGAALHVPRPRWCTDNAAMIAGAAYALAAPREGAGHAPADRRLNAVASWRLHRDVVGA
ncbi:MAG: tRNA (adenosine(37)-N6)-threonylcarbamoyltransferase complex transferase subunit TsaD [Myxococcales bacterium]|nr:tRNA (adenosine(37)-N6)-threonylcarbamoyltransferase complex transferase subunit TsaD [Myxococcales bacterium]